MGELGRPKVAFEIVWPLALVGAKNFFKNHRDEEGEDEANQSTTEIHEAKVDIFWEGHKIYQYLQTFFNAY